MPSRPVPRTIQKKSRRKFPLKSAIIFFAALVLIFAAAPRVKQHGITVNNPPSPSFDKKQYSLNDPSSIWAVVNKGRGLPAAYVPPDLIVPNVLLRLSATDPEMQIRSAAAPALQQMFKDAASQNLHLMLSSGYRSYGLQRIVYSSYVNSQGQQGADSSSAKPGHSEHQTGLAIDIEPASRECEVELCFADTAEGKWLAANSYKYGFIIRYQKDREKLTGYEYEPWHVRYVGADLAAQLYKTNKTMEQFFGLPAFADYSSSAFQLKAGA
jgi:D-alanyl-D-alanine carboxypeptidase